MKTNEPLKIELQRDFNEKAVSFITDVFTIENKRIPSFKNNDEVLGLYTKTLLRINDELMWHRNKPIESDRLKNLREIKSLPKSTRIILESLTN
jgi:hypothetical protein